MSSAARRNAIARLRDLFEKKYFVDARTHCWLWTAAITNTGAPVHGALGLASVKTKPAKAISWLLYRDQDFDLDQPAEFRTNCGSQRCVNPAHITVDWLFDFARPQIAIAVIREIAKEHPHAAGMLIEASKLITDSPSMDLSSEKSISDGCSLS